MHKNNSSTPSSQQFGVHRNQKKVSFTENPTNNRGGQQGRLAATPTRTPTMESNIATSLITDNQSTIKDQQQLINEQQQQQPKSDQSQPNISNRSADISLLERISSKIRQTAAGGDLYKIYNNATQKYNNPKAKPNLNAARNRLHRKAEDHGWETPRKFSKTTVTPTTNAINTNNQFGELAATNGENYNDYNMDTIDDDYTETASIASGSSSEKNKHRKRPKFQQLDTHQMLNSTEQHAPMTQQHQTATRVSENDNDEEENENQSKKTRMPEITVMGKVEIRELIDHLDSVNELKGQFYIREKDAEQHIIYSHSLSIFENIKKTLKEKKFEFFTYTPKCI